MLSQVEDSAHPVLQERCRKVTVSCRKIPKIAGTWKQYSGWKSPGFFPMDSYRLPVLSGRNQPEIIEKNPNNFQPEYCFHKITGITRNWPFLGQTVRPGFLISLLQLKHMAI
jgi:hypothetical protein